MENKLRNKQILQIVQVIIVMVAEEMYNIYT